mgnify:FL=1
MFKKTLTLNFSTMQTQKDNRGYCPYASYFPNHTKTNGSP